MSTATPEVRGRSLFWAIAGMFLVAVVLGTLLQILVVAVVLRPLEGREARARAELAAASLAAELSSPAAPRGAALDSLLAERRTALGPRPPWLAFQPAGGSLVAWPRGREPLVQVLLARGGTSAAVSDSARAGRPWTRVELLARHRVMRGGRPAGDVVIVRPEWPWLSLGPDPYGAPPWLLFLPIAVITSTLGGLVLLRLLVRRLRALEALAARVAEGDFGVRVDDRHRDEIGRVARGLNRMTERLHEAREDLARHERQRRQLFADITHELATPLTSIRGYAETLLDPSVPISDDERARYVRGMLEESRRLDRLTRDLFELARLEAGAAPLEREPLDLAALARNTTARFDRRFRDAGLHVTWDAAPSEAWIQADGRRIEQVLDNLLANALRYVPVGGHVAMTLDRVPAGRFRLTIADDGPGLPESELPHVFERFYRASGRAPTARDGGGSGLGLAIVREIVTRHDGTVHAEARQPHGLAIVVELPGANGHTAIGAGAPGGA